MKGVRRRLGSEPAETRSARGAAFHILARVEETDAWASVLVGLAASRLDDPREAALTQELVLGVLRRRSVLDHALARVSRRRLADLDPPVLRAMRLGAYALLYLDRVPDFAAVDTSVELVKRAGGRGAAAYVNGVLRAVGRRGRDLLPPRPPEGNTAALALFHSHPEWWTRRVVERLGWQGAARLLEANNRPAPVVLRPNARRITPPRLQSRLAEEGVRVEPCHRVPEALRVVAGSAQGTRAFQQGLGWVQDEAAQLVPKLFGPVLRSRVADLCAAPGIKSLQLAEALPPDGVLVAVDRNEARMGRLLDNVRRVGGSRILPVVAEIGEAGTPLRAPFDHVLVDAPCTGTGTLRRHPEIRWRLRPGDPIRLARLQAGILDAAAGLVGKGGTLVYSVCSLEPEEGEQVVAAFLARHSRFRLADPRPALPKAARPLVDEQGMLRTSPSSGAMDGFFAALLVES